MQDGAAFLILSFAVAAGVAIAFPVASMDSLDATPSDGVALPRRAFSSVIADSTRGPEP